MIYDDLTMKEFDEIRNEKTIVILPVGVIEEHSSHLPLSTDSIQAEYVCREIAKRMNALLLPPIRYGVCSSTKNFPGSISISFDTLRSLIKDILVDLHRNGIKNVVIISGHAGRSHMAAMKIAAEDVLKDRKMRIMLLTDYDIIPSLGEKYMPKGDGHAGFAETSRVLAIRPDLVKGREKEHYAEFPDFVILRHPEKYFPLGVMGGNPENASAEIGKEINEKVIDIIEDRINKMMELNLGEL